MRHIRLRSQPTVDSSVVNTFLNATSFYSNRVKPQ